MTICASPSTPDACATSWSPKRTIIYGVIRVNTGMRRGLEGAQTGVSLGDVASRDFILVDEDETAFEVIRRMWRQKAIMAVVVRGRPGSHVGAMLPA